MEIFVVDASVGVKWIFNEEFSDKALLLLEEFTQGRAKLYVPDFFYIELANACWVREKKKLSSFAEAVEALDRMMSFQLGRYPDNELADVALENALRFKISAYDGLYLALAEIYVAPLVTADEALLKACQGRFDFIEPLSEFSLS